MVADVVEFIFERFGSLTPEQQRPRSRTCPDVEAWRRIGWVMKRVPGGWKPSNNVMEPGSPGGYARRAYGAN
jgi:hypothetical protein